MRRLTSFDCEGDLLCATLDEAAGETGVLIVSGGNEIRIGAHRGMARLSSDLAQAGLHCFRFDRRGIGDSEGDNRGFEDSGADIAAALFAFRAACPQLKHVVAFGNCDAASALLLHQPDGIDALVLSNIWVLEPRSDDSDLPPAAEIRSRYSEKLRDPKEWVRLFSGAVNLRKLASGLLAVLRPPAPASALSQRVAQGLARFKGPIRILLAARDGTALAFTEAWKHSDFAPARARRDVELTSIDTASHSFASEADYAALKATIIAACANA